jgi:hypothetical protein
MKKVVIAGSSKLRPQIEKWIQYWGGKKDHVVLNHPKVITDDLYAETHMQFFRDILQADILFIANEDKNDIKGYIGAETFGELEFGLAQNLIQDKHLNLVLAQMPAKEVFCYDEIVTWKRLGWIQIFESK